MANRYRSYVQKSFFRYTFSIILFLCILIFTFLTINIKWLTKAESQRNTARIAEVLEQEVVNYKEGLESLVIDFNIINVCKQQAKEQVAKANRILYDFSNSQKIRGVFTLVDIHGNIICSNLYKDNRKIFVQSFLYKSLVTKMLYEPEKTFLLQSR